MYYIDSKLRVVIFDSRRLGVILFLLLGIGRAGWVILECVFVIKGYSFDVFGFWGNIRID